MGEDTKRVHISGLNPAQCSVQDIHSRFESLQVQVRQVHNWPPGKDGVGNVQNWCFVTLEGESVKIKRAVEVLNGTIWKGSKLRIGNAKKEEWKEASAKVDEATEQPEKPKKKRRSKGVESENIDQPVSAKDVEDGLWGWKKTPAGHLLRPLHLRPNHPLPLPSARPVEEDESEDKKRRRKRKEGKMGSSIRAKRVTVDPSRYGSVHLAGPLLDDEKDGLPSNSEWVCSEDEDGNVEWLLKDKEGNTTMREQVQLRKKTAAREANTDSEAESEEDSSMDDEVAAAIENAESDSSSSSEEEVVSHAPQEAAKEKARELEIPAYDPAEDSDFSEGYQEVQPNLRIPVGDWQEEKANHLTLLKNMFGGVDLPLKPAPSLVAEHGVTEEESEEEEEAEENEATPTEVVAKAPLTGAQKRAALLDVLTSGQQDSKSFKPSVRFDPGIQSTEPEESDVEMEESNVEEEQIIPREGAAAEPRADRVEMSSLKDMFRPKEDSKGFTLLGDLDLDLEEEMEEEDNFIEPELVTDQKSVITYPPAQQVAPSVPSAKLPFFFPTSDGNDKSWLSILENDRSVALFCKDKTDEEIQAQWKERKGQLTQDYKRRHREALKKKKRKYTGSRAAGTSMPLRS